jgi:CheY-like chemotaxis protein
MSKGSTLRILSLEDDLLEADLVKETLEGAGIDCQVTRIETEAELIGALEQGNIDLILADYTLPAFDGLSALAIARRYRPDVPFIFVSGTLGEEVAIEALKIGATDYVLKTRLSRLVPSLHRAMRESRERAERKRAEDALRRSEAYLATAQRLSSTGSFGWNVASGEIFWSLETFRICGYATAPTVTIDLILDRTQPEDRAAVKDLMDRVSVEKTAFDFERRLLMPGGAVKHLRVVGHPSENESGNFEFVGAVTDITERSEPKRSWPVNSTCASKNGSPSARGSPVSCMTRCCKAFKAFCLNLALCLSCCRTVPKLRRRWRAPSNRPERPLSKGGGHAGPALIDICQERSCAGDQQTRRGTSRES